jgi:hypothetical protein
MPSYKQEEPKSNGAFFVEPGIYQIEVKNAIEKQSQNGNEMIKLICKVVLPSGGVGPEIHDHLVFTARASWKIDQFLASIGQAVVPGEEVNIEADDLIGVVGVALIGEEPGQTNPDQKFNTIERWIFGEERTDWIKRQSDPQPRVKQHPQKAKIQDNDEIPF